MALSQDEWYQKLKSWVPAWWWEQEVQSRAIFQGFAKVLEQVQLDAEDYAKQTYILKAKSPILDAHGDERSVERLTDEVDSVYAQRIRNILSSADKASIKKIVDALLVSGTCEIREAPADNAFADRGYYCNDNEFLFEHYYNAFLIVCNKQVNTPTSFVDRGIYLDNDSQYLGYASSLTSVYNSIIQAVNAAKAFGVSYMLVERH